MANTGLRDVTSGLRRKVVERVVRFVDFRVGEASRPLREQVEHLQACTDDHRRRLDEAEGRLHELHNWVNWVSGEVERISPHVAAQESQLEALRQKLTAVPAADAAEADAARSLIDEIRREHAQIKVRLSGIARYEDRLRKLEDVDAPAATS